MLIEVKEIKILEWHDRLKDSQDDGHHYGL